MLATRRDRFDARAEYAPPRNDVEVVLARIWKTVVAFEGDVGFYDDFAALGGDSFKTLLLIHEVELLFGLAVPPGYFGRITTIIRMAVQVADLL